LVHIVQSLRNASADDAALSDVVALLEPAAIQVDEAARALRDYLRRADVDPAELARVEARLTAIHDMARRHRVKPDELHALAQATAARLSDLDLATNADALARNVDEARARYDGLAKTLTEKRTTAA